MPIHIQAPDGSIAEFPDGTTDEVIKSVMARYFGGPSGGNATAPKGPRYPDQSGGHTPNISGYPASPQDSSGVNGSVFEVQAPDGSLYEVQAPDMDAAVEGFKRHWDEEQQSKKFDITAPNGKKYRITGASSEGALDALRKHLGGSRDAAAQDGSLSAENAVRSTATGVPIIGGMLNKIDAATNATLAPLIDPLLPDSFQKLPGPTWDERYQHALDIQNGKDSAFESEHPYADAGLNMAGAVGGMVPAIMAAPMAFGAGGGGLIGRTLWSAGSGATIGGADSAIRSDGDMSRAGFGALAGLVTGAVAPTAGKLVGAGWQRLRDFRAANAAAQASGVDRGTLSTIGRAVRDDGFDPTTVGQRMGELGPDAMMMDLGPNLQRQAGALAATPGRGQEIVRSAIASRQAGAGSRIGSALDDALGQPADTLALADDIVARRADAAKPLYQKAYQEGSSGVWSPELERMAGSPMFADAMRRAATTGQDRAILDGFGSFNPRVSISQDGRISFNQAKAGGSPLYPDLQYWDYVKRNLDDIAGEAKRAGRSEQASIATNLASRLRNELDTAVPSYKAARDAYSGPSAILDAMEEGQGIFRNSYTPGQLRQKLATMNDAEKEAFTQGARSQVADVMGTARNDALAARSTFQKGYNRDKLAMLVGKDEASKMLHALDAETTFARTRDVVTGNSETAARSAAMREIAGESGPQFGVREGYMSGGVLGAARSAGMRTAERVIAGLLSAGREARNSGLAEAISRKDFQTIVEALTASQGKPVNDRSIDAVARALLVGGGTAAARP